MRILKMCDIDLLEFGHTTQLSGMILNDSKFGVTMIAMLPDEEIFDDTAILDLSWGDWKKLIQQTDVQMVEILVNDKGKFKKAIISKSTRQIEQNVSWNVYRRDNYKCRYCGRADVPLTVDHLILWEDGGSSIEENLVACCRRCNKVRGNMKYEDWINSSKYEKLSEGLGISEKCLNAGIVSTIANIPIRKNIRRR